jgi:hypothetical protein
VNIQNRSILLSFDVVRLSTNVPVKEDIGNRVQGINADRIMHFEHERRYGDNGSLFMKDILSF